MVDDDPSVRDLMAVVLQMHGFEVLRARHSDDALSQSGLYAGSIDLLLTDFCMKPYPNGFELARLIRAQRPGIKVVYASGFVDHNALRDEIASSASVFLAKPFTPAGLLACVLQAMAIPA